MPWIALEPTAFSHRKTLRLSIALGLRETHVVGHLARLWTWALASAPDGELDDEPEVVARAADWTGELLEIADGAGFVAALVEAGFVERIDVGRLRLHGWRERHEAWAERREQEARSVEQREAERRRRQRERQAAYRERQRRGEMVTAGDVTVTQVVRSRIGDRDALVGQKVNGVTSHGANGVTVRDVTGDACRDRTGPDRTSPDRTSPDRTGPDAPPVSPPRAGGSPPPAPPARGRGAVQERNDGSGVRSSGGGEAALLEPRPLDAVAVWNQALGVLRGLMSAANFEAYFEGSRGVRAESDGIVVEVASSLARQTLEQRFRRQIARALYDVVGRRVTVTLIVGSGQVPAIVGQEADR